MPTQFIFRNDRNKQAPGTQSFTEEEAIAGRIER